MDSDPRSQGNSGHPASMPAANEPFTAPPQARPGRRLWVVLLLFGLFGSLLLNLLLFPAALLSGFASFDADRKVQEEYFSHAKDGRSKVAVISVEGTILQGDGFIKRQIDRAADDPDVKAVVLRVNSPGGTVTGSDQLYHYLCQLRQQREIPIVVSMGGMAASGGYYVAMACGDEKDVIFAEPTTWTGSIGVIIPHYDISGLLERYDVKQDSIASGPYKQMFSSTKTRSDEERKAEREILERLVGECFSRFKKVILDGRPDFKKNPAALDALATGQIYTADQAKEGGLVDRIGFIEDAIDRAIELAKLDASDVKVVRYKPEPSLASRLLGVRSHSQPFDMAAMLEMTAPRAYYLCTWLPAVAGCEKP